MMQDRDSSVLMALEELRNSITERSETIDDARAAIMLQQAFDRLYVAYSTGQVDASEVMSKVEALRHSLQSSPENSAGLRVGGMGFRDKVLSRNHRILAERLLSEERGRWDARKLELVQSSIAHIASHGSTAEADDLALSLQTRLSDSVWTSGFELADTRSQLDEASQSLETALASFLARREHGEHGELQTDDDVRELLKPETKEVLRAALSGADVDVLRARVSDASLARAELTRSETELRAAEELHLRQRLEIQKKKAHSDAAERIAQASESVRGAGLELLSGEYQALAKIQRELLLAARDADIGVDKAKIEAKFDGLSQEGAGDSVEDLGQRLAILGDIAAHLSSTGKLDLSGLERSLFNLKHRQHMLASVLEFSVDSDVSESKQGFQDQAFILEARTMYEQQLVRFERDASAGAAAAEMLKAFDYDVDRPRRFVPEQSTEPTQSVTTPLLASQWRSIDAAVKRVHHIAQSSQSGELGLYAPLAGAEHSASARRAVQIADKATPFVVASPSIQREDLKRSNRLLSDAKQLAYHPSVRADMGFAGRRYQIDDASARPLFKRVRFNRDDKDTAKFLPALYRVADIRMRKDASAMPLRKSAKRDLDLSSINLELIRTIESQFDSSMSARTSDGVDGVASQAGQYIGDNFESHKRVTQSISDWVGRRHDKRRMFADTASLVKTEQMDNAQIEGSLRTEGQPLPTGARRKLEPFLGFDVSKVRIFSGPIAEMASDAMGAHAFTLGKNIFFGNKKLDFETPEGLGLLAHELLHTSHFNSGSSVGSKEDEAEAIEARVKSAFGSDSAMDLAVEGDGTKAGQIDQSSTHDGDAPASSVGKRHNLTAEVVFDEVANRVLDMLTESVNRQKERKGG